jgi:hypothetical protein
VADIPVQAADRHAPRVRHPGADGARGAAGGPSLYQAPTPDKMYFTGRLRWLPPYSSSGIAQIMSLP